jgi:hypothetical protein
MLPYFSFLQLKLTNLIGFSDLNVSTPAFFGFSKSIACFDAPDVPSLRSVFVDSIGLNFLAKGFNCLKTVIVRFLPFRRFQGPSQAA